ncbi:tetratricopeptide repeat protein [Nisaea denitrificans]|uniref:tetratricopeptide repeat protein n=1 Tax=Nisaea denitrificans TaxID=390877 RepID=UPI0003F6DF02|nr:tetratricopeptide repeat protein [Nisaea denitrificans]
MLSLSRAAAIQTLQNALAIHNAGRIGEAVPLYETAAPQLQDLSHFWHFYGLALFQSGATAKAIDCFRRSLLLAPGDANCINRFACVFLSGDDPDDAWAQLRHALVVAPDHPEAWRNIAEAERLRGDPSNARTSLEKAMALRSEEASWKMSYAAVLNDLELPEEALSALQSFSKSSTPTPEYYFQEARAFFDAFKASTAIMSYRKSLLMTPGAPQALNNLQLLERRVGRMRDGVKSATRACVLEPGNTGLQHGLTDALLSAGEIERGQARNFWRHLKPEILIIRQGLPEEWDGEPCRDGQVLLICHEQGIGDEIRFASCIPDIQKRFRGPVILESDKRLTALFARSFPGLTVVEKVQRSDTDPPTAQYRPLVQEHGIGRYMMLADLQSVVRPSVEAFPDQAGYLEPDATETAHWKDRFRATGSRPAVGISWRSGMRRAGARHNYPELKDIVPLLEAAEFLPVCLQYDASDSETEAIQATSGRQLYIPSGIDQREELDRVAAMIAALDLVISPNTSVLMIAGAVGTPSIGLHSQCGAIFFGAERDPWFPGECSLVKTGDRSWPALIDEAVPHLIRMLSSSG